jgi:hypothetical protein
MIYDIIVCLGPNDDFLLSNIVTNTKLNIINSNKLYIITNSTIRDRHINQFNDDVIFIDENNFPFSKDYIDKKFNKPSRSGWYLQQLLKLYAPIIISTLLDNYLILDADVYFHNPVLFFENNKVLLNTGTEHHTPYFEHMKKLDSSLFRVYNCSGICHLFPVKKKFIYSLINKIELTHKKPFWEVFLDCVDSNHYEFSGASEYEILFNYIILHFPNEYEINNLIWRNTPKITSNFQGHYEACHHYSRI